MKKHPVYRIIESLGWEGSVTQVQTRDRSLDVRQYTFFQAPTLPMRGTARGDELITPKEIKITLKPFLAPDGMTYWVGRHEDQIVFEVD